MQPDVLKVLPLRNPTTTVAPSKRCTVASSLLRHRPCPARIQDLQSARINQLWDVDTAMIKDCYVLRHGRSEANEMGRIASDPSVACQRYGLTAEGFRQAQHAAHELIAVLPSSVAADDPPHSVVLISSDFKRARETAETVYNVLVSHSWRVTLILDERLRERYFGQWDGTSDTNYELVWADDIQGICRNGVESVESVMYRTTDCVRSICTECPDPVRVFVAHGDVLQILQTAFLKQPANCHRTVPHLETAQLRKLELVPSTSTEA